MTNKGKCIGVVIKTRHSKICCIPRENWEKACMTEIILIVMQMKKIHPSHKSQDLFHLLVASSVRTWGLFHLYWGAYKKIWTYTISSWGWENHRGFVSKCLAPGKIRGLSKWDQVISSSHKCAEFKPLNTIMQSDPTPCIYGILSKTLWKKKWIKP